MICSSESFPMTKNEKRRQKRKEQKAHALGISVQDVVDGRGRHNNHPKGSNHYKWQSELLSKDGYRLVRVGCSHPLADPNGYVREHILIAASVYGIKSIEGMVVHHINGDKLDNRIENLQIMSVSEHNQLHNKGKIRDVITGRFISKRAGCLIDSQEWHQFPTQEAVDVN